MPDPATDAHTLPDWMGLFTRGIGAIHPAAAWGSALPGLSQPILPGWTLGNVINVTEANSRSPQTERDIVAQQSYGRQLGTIMEALAFIVKDQGLLKGEEPKALRRLMALNEAIEQIKEQSLASRVERLESDLAHLEKTDPERYAWIVQRAARKVPRSL